MRMKKKLAAILLLFMAVLMIPGIAQGSGQHKLVYIIPIHDEITRSLTVFIDKSIKEAEKNEADLILFDMDTPGGSVSEAVNIGKMLDETKVDSAVYADSRALSAGSYIALHADHIYMTPNATMGASAIVDQKGNMADEKAKSFWRAAMKNAAEQHRRSPEYAMAMADPEIDLPKLNAGKGDLLTLTADQAEKVRYSEGTYKNIESLLSGIGYKDAKVEKMDLSPSEKFAKFLTNPFVVPILLTAASLGLVLELYSPGFGIAGTAGLSALVLFFYGHLVAGLAGYESLVMFIIGLLLLVIELFVPGAIAGIIGAAAIIVSLFMAAGNVMYMGISILIAAAAAIIGMIVMVKIFGKQMKLFKKMILFDSTNTESGYVSNVNRLELIGRIGIAKTPLRPAGTIVIDDERVDVVSEGGYISKDVKVMVMKVEGSRIIVREYSKIEE